MEVQFSIQDATPVVAHTWGLLAGAFTFPGTLLRATRAELENAQLDSQFQVQTVGSIAYLGAREVTTDVRSYASKTTGTLYVSILLLTVMCMRSV